MAGAPPTNTTHLEGKSVHSNEQGQVSEGHNPVIPEDGYEWKKYGQKFIQNNGINRSYFKCREKTCNAKKRVEWPPSDPSSTRIAYDGEHDHPCPRPRSSSEQEALARMANRYDLSTQFFGSANDSF